MAHYLNGQKTKEPELLHPGPAAVKNTQLGVIDENSFTVPNVATAEVYVHAKELPTKDSFCNVAQKIAKPEFSDSGYEKNIKNPASEADKIEVSTPILSETLDSYNGKYTPMEECRLNHFSDNSTHEIDNANELKRNDGFCTVSGEIEKPELEDSGYTKNLNFGVSDKHKLRDVCSLPERPNLYKQNGASVNHDHEDFDIGPFTGHFTLPRHVMESSFVEGLSLKEFKILVIIYQKLLYKPRSHNVNGEEIMIHKGEFCFSERQLLEICNKGVTVKSEKISKTTLHRALQKFFQKKILKKAPILDQVSDHKVSIRKTVVRSTYPMHCETLEKKEKQDTGPHFGPKVGPNLDQDWTIKEYCEDSKEHKETVTVDGFSTSTVLRPDIAALPKEWENRGSLQKYSEPVIKEAWRQLLLQPKDQHKVNYFTGICKRLAGSPQSSAPPPSKQKTQNNKQVEINCDIELQNENKKHAEIKKTELESINLFKLIEICRQSVCLRLPGLEKKRIYYADPRFKEIINELLGDNYEKCKSNAVQSGSGNDCYRDDAKFGSV